ncbi:hypothetical protein Mgra_00005581, partial [Meloidogyne graminicola]
MLSMKFLFILLLLFVYLNIKINCESTVEECDKIMNSNVKYSYNDCSCLQDMKVCQFSLYAHVTCSNDELADFFNSKKTCS